MSNDMNEQKGLAADRIIVDGEVLCLPQPLSPKGLYHIVRHPGNAVVDGTSGCLQEMTPAEVAEVDEQRARLFLDSRWV